MGELVAQEVTGVVPEVEGTAEDEDQEQGRRRTRFDFETPYAGVRRGQAGWGVQTCAGKWMGSVAWDIRGRGGGAGATAHYGGERAGSCNWQINSSTRFDGIAHAPRPLKIMTQPLREAKNESNPSGELMYTSSGRGYWRDTDVDGCANADDMDIDKEDGGYYGDFEEGEADSDSDYE